MSHKLIEADVKEGSKKKSRKLKLSIPKFDGKFGVSFFFSDREVFLGIQVNEVIKETVVRKRFTKPRKAGVKVFRFD